MIYVGFLGLLLLLLGVCGWFPIWQKIISFLFLGHFLLTHLIEVLVHALID
jgi:hypothetical protein